MSDTFTAKTGRTVAIKSRSTTGTVLEISGIGTRTTVDLGDVETLREFFQHERDKELGRWRSRDEPNWVVYHAPNVNGDHYVLNELTGNTALWGRDTARGSIHSGESKAIAVEYFAAHPEPKPWHAAKPGEVWALIVDGVEKAFTLHGDLFRTGNLHDIEQTDGHITAGRRIWPEGKP